MFCTCKKLFSILSVSIYIIFYIHIYSNNNVSLFVGETPFYKWFDDKKNNKELEPIFKNEDILSNFVIQDKNGDIKVIRHDEYGNFDYYCNKLNIENIKDILKINGDNFIILLDNVTYLYNEEDDDYKVGLIAILLQKNNYEIIYISPLDNENHIFDKTDFRLCRTKYFSVYKIDLKDLGFKMNKIQPVIHTEVHPVKPVAVKPAVQPVPQIEQPEIQPVQPVVLKNKNIDPGVSNKGNSIKSNSNDNNLCSCKSEIKITS